MSWHPSSVSVVLVLTAAMAACVALTAWRRRAAPGALALVFLMAAIAEWTFMRGLEMAAVGTEQKLVWARLRYLGVVSVAPLWLMFALGHARQVTLRRRTRLALWVVPVISMAVALTSQHHRLLWTSVTPSPSDPKLLVYGHGPWFWVVIGYSYVLIAVGSGAIALAAARLPGAFGKQSAALLFSAAVPCVGNVLYVTGMIPVPGLDLTPIALTASGLVTAWVVFRRDLLDLVPFAREVLLDHLVDGVIVLDVRGRIVDVNQAAARFLAVTPASSVGHRRRSRWPRGRTFSPFSTARTS